MKLTLKFFVKIRFPGCEVNHLEFEISLPGYEINHLEFFVEVSLLGYKLFLKISIVELGHKGRPRVFSYQA